MAAIAAAGMKFTILAPWQGEFRADGDDGGAGPFLWQRGDWKLAVFRFDRDLCGSISFGDALSDGRRLAESVAQRATTLKPGGVLLIATDGETFGHHKKSGAAELARAFSILEDREGIKVTNCGEYLASHPASGAFVIHGATSWSCGHGVERWRSNCGCRMDGNTSQEWRAPLREAMEFVRNHADSVYDRFAAPMLQDQIGALKGSMRLAIDPNPAAAESFFRRYHVADEDRREQLMRLFEMERAGDATLVSCAWFFDDFSGPEGRVVLRWAARAVELAAGFAPSIESELLERLRAIKSHRRDIGDAATLYLSLKTREARGRG